MSQFEESVKPLLRPIIQGTPMKWNEEEQRKVARWVFKTVLMIDRSTIREKQITPDEDFRYLFAHRAPPPSVNIFSGRYLPEEGEEFRPAWAGTAWTDAGQKLSSGEEYNGYRVTFTVG